MVFTDTGKDKIAQICEQLRKETLDPAEAEAAKIIEQAEERASAIVNGARKEAEGIIGAARAEIEKEREVLTSSLKLACKKSLSYLKQEIGSRIFSQELDERVKKHLSKDDLVAKAIEVIFEAIAKEGFEGAVEVALPKGVSDKAVLAALTDQVKAKIGQGSVAFGDFEGGAAVKLVDDHLTVDLTDESVQSLMQKFLSGAFHKFIFEE